MREMNRKNLVAKQTFDKLMKIQWNKQKNTTNGIDGILDNIETDEARE